MDEYQQSILKLSQETPVVVEMDPSGRFQRFQTCLGRGAYKEVFHAFDQEEMVEVAWNQLRMDHLGRKDTSRLLSEIRILESLRNDHIINLYAAWMSVDPETGKDRICFITEMMTSGTLKVYLKRSPVVFKPKVLKNWAKQILSGLHYLHTRSPPIIHRDLKCENIFINGNNGQAKIGDLGLAAVKSREHLSSVLGTPEFMAPELYDERYDEKVDIYGFGMVMLEIVTKDYPYSECSNQAQIYKKVSSGIKPISLASIEDAEVKAFIEICLEFNPLRRPTAEQLLQHPFILSQEAPFVSVVDLPTESSLDEELLLRNASPLVSDAESRSSDHLPSLHPSSASFSSQSPSVSPVPNIIVNQKSYVPSGLAHTVTAQGLVQTVVNADIIKKKVTTGLVYSGNVDILMTPSPSAASVLSTTTVDAETHTFEVSEMLDRVPHSQTVASCTVELLGAEGGILMLKMVYTNEKDVIQEIKFPFNLAEDTPTNVVSEMISEHLIQVQDEFIVRKRLEESLALISLAETKNTIPLENEITPTASPSVILNVMQLSPQPIPGQLDEISISQPALDFQPILKDFPQPTMNQLKDSKVSLSVLSIDTSRTPPVPSHSGTVSPNPSSVDREKGLPEPPRGRSPSPMSQSQRIPSPLRRTDTINSELRSSSLQRTDTINSEMSARISLKRTDTINSEMSRISLNRTDTVKSGTSLARMPSIGSVSSAEIASRLTELQELNLQSFNMGIRQPESTRSMSSLMKDVDENKSAHASPDRSAPVSYNVADPPVVLKGSPNAQHAILSSSLRSSSPHRSLTVGQQGYGLDGLVRPLIPQPNPVGLRPSQFTAQTSSSSIKAIPIPERRQRSDSTSTMSSVRSFSHSVEALPSLDLKEFDTL